ncbi:MAG: hypothetical protein ACSHX9_13315 [Luteolibacter sp.]
MKNFLTTLSFIAIGITVGFADVPKKIPLYQHAGLWTDSPFTSKPPPPEKVSPINPLNDYTLTGIAPVPGGYRVTIISKKDPTVKEVISPGGDGPFRVISVNRNPGQSLGTTVVLSSGSMQGTVSFEPDLVSVNAPPAPASSKENQQAQQPITPPGFNQNAGQQNGGPRPRIVPPTPQNNGKKGNNNDKKKDNQRPDRR